MREIRLINGTPLERDKVSAELEKTDSLKVSAICRKPLVPANKKNAEALASARFAGNMPPTVKKNLERIEKRLLKEKKYPGGVIYHGFKFQEILSEVFKKESGRNSLNVCLTMRLLGTAETVGGLPHIRMLIMGNPAVISLRGILKGPARSREYFRGKDEKNTLEGISDYRIPEIVAGLALQAAFYFFLGEMFCSSPDCRLFNPHWQRDMLRALAGGGEFCRRHSEMLNSL